MRICMCFQRGSFIYTYIFLYAIPTVMEIDMSKMERQILPAMKIILTHNKRMCSSLPRHP